MSNTYTTSFGLGDRVFAVQREIVWERSACDTCNSSGMIEFKGENWLCPACRGHLPNVAGSKTWKVCDERMCVGAVKIEELADKYEEMYMLEETGVGSGRLWDYRLLFKTEDEAQDACNLWNSNLRLPDGDLWE